MSVIVLEGWEINTCTISYFQHTYILAYVYVLLLGGIPVQYSLIMVLSSPFRYISYAYSKWIPVIP